MRQTKTTKIKEPISSDLSLLAFLNLKRFEDDQTNLKKFGAIFGDGAQTGCNSVTNPGTLFLPNAAIYPTKNVGGIVDNELGKLT